MKLTKKLLAVAMAAMTCTMCINFPSEKSLTVNAAEFSDELKYGEYLYYKQVDEEGDGTYDYIEISNCDQSATEIEIPEEIDGLPVTSIFPRYISTALSENLETIVIPKTVKEIGFSYYMESHEINIKGDHLKSVIVSPDNPYFSSEDGVLFNKNKTTLLKYPSAKTDTSYVIPETVELIESCAFQKCQNLSSIVIGNGVQKIDAEAFRGCSAIEQIIIPDSVSDIGCGCFRDCISLKSIKLSENITEIGCDTFYRCTSLKSVTIPAKVKKIGMAELSPDSGGSYLDVFSGCPSLEEINVDENNENYASENGILFSKNKDVLFLYPSQKNDREYAVPEGVERLEGDAFRYCDNLESIYFPDSLRRIGYLVFDGCTSLRTIEVDKDNAYYCDIDGVLFDKIFSELIKYPEGKQNAEYIIPKSVTRIGYAAFSGCKGLKSITIPDGVTIIGSQAFSGCDGLKNITIPDSVTSIENGAFEDCSSLTTVTILNPECTICDHKLTICNDLTFDNGTWITTYSGVIIGYSGSTAQAYAEKYGYNFKLINEIPDVTEPVVTTLPVETTKPTEIISSVETTNPAETTAPIETTTPAVTTKPSEATSALITTETVQTTTNSSGDIELSMKELEISVGNKIQLKVKNCDTDAEWFSNNSDVVTVDKNGYVTAMGEGKAKIYAIVGDVTLVCEVNVFAGSSIQIVGDSNGDGKVNVRDCAFIASALAKGQGDSLPKSSDFNGDGKVNVRDAAAIASYLAKGTIK